MLIVFIHPFIYEYPPLIITGMSTFYSCHTHYYTTYPKSFITSFCCCLYFSLFGSLISVALRRMSVPPTIRILHYLDKLHTSSGISETIISKRAAHLDCAFYCNHNADNAKLSPELYPNCTVLLTCYARLNTVLYDSLG